MRLGCQELKPGGALKPDLQLQLIDYILKLAGNEVKELMTSRSRSFLLNETDFQS